MNAIQPAAHVRAFTGFQDSKAGAGSIVHCAWNRSLLWLLVRFLPLVILTLFLSAPDVQAAATIACQDGAATTVDGTIFKVLRGDTTLFYIHGTTLDCDPVYIETSNEQTCVFHGQIHASGTLSKPVFVGSRVEWSLTNATFSCQ